MCTWFQVTVLKEVTFIIALQELVLKAISSKKKLNLSFNVLEQNLNPYSNGKYHIVPGSILLVTVPTAGIPLGILIYIFFFLGDSSPPPSQSSRIALTNDSVFNNT